MGHHKRLSDAGDAEIAYPLESLFGRVLSPLEEFLRRTTAGGLVLVATTLVTLAIANTGVGPQLAHFLEQSISLRLGGDWTLELSLHHWINDGLMALFFLLVGLELKRELLVGELSTLRDAALPIIAAAGGMLVPALIYSSLNMGLPSASGWGIPTATDIAFAVGILVLLAARVPRNLIVFLMALAIADDLGAVLIIALFYTKALALGALAGVVIATGALALLNRGGIRQPLPYWLIGLVLWYCLLLSGLHATLAGIVFAFAVPARPAFSSAQFDARVRQLAGAFRAHAQDPTTPSDVLTSHDMATIAANLEAASKAVQSPLQRTEHGLSPWVTFVILPLFALANAGIDFRSVDVGAMLGQPATLGVALGLVLGKFVGVSGATWLAIKFGVGRLPHGVGWHHLLGAAWLAGIGFTMSLFISRLAFADVLLLDQAKLGILLASGIAAAIGTAWLLFASRSRAAR